jgi:uncharacterized membrane protein YwzB
MRTGLVILVLLIFLAVTAGWALYAWMSLDNVPISGHGYTAMVLGIIFSLALGCGLMASCFTATDMAMMRALIDVTEAVTHINERNAMATWSLGGRHAPDKPPTPIYINLDNVLTVEREGDLTTVIMVGGEVVYIDTMPDTLIGTL